MTTATKAQMDDLVAWLADHQKIWQYSEGSGRETPETSHRTDCSGLERWLYREFFGITIGDTTRDECNYGRLITTSKADARVGKGMVVGDAIFYLWPGDPGPWSHVNTFVGGDAVQNQGGPGPGPVKQSLMHNVDLAEKVRVMRFVELAPPAPKPASAGPFWGRKWPDYMKAGDFFGPASAGAHAHHGAFQAEKLDIDAIQWQLEHLRHYTIGADHNGTFAAQTQGGVERFTYHHMDKLATHGFVTEAVWNKLFSL